MLAAEVNELDPDLCLWMVAVRKSIEDAHVLLKKLVAILEGSWLLGQSATAQMATGANIQNFKILHEFWPSPLPVQLAAGAKIQKFKIRPPNFDPHLSNHLAA